MPTLTKKKSNSPEKAATDGDNVKLSKKAQRAQAAMDKPFVPTLPIVNLLSEEVQEVVEQRRLKRLFMMLGGVAVALVVIAWLLQAGVIAVAQKHRDEAAAAAQQATAKKASLAYVATYYGQIKTNKFTIQSTMANEVLTSKVLGYLAKDTPAGVSFDNVALSLDSSAAAPGAAVPAAGGTAGTCPSPDPYTTSVLTAGCMNVSGKATSRAAAGQFINAIEHDPHFTVAFIPSTTSGQGTAVTFSATVGLNAAKVHENRYANPNFLKAGN